MTATIHLSELEVKELLVQALEKKGISPVSHQNLIFEIKEYDKLAQESYDNLVRSLIEAGGEMRVAHELLSRSLEMLYLLGYDSSFTNPAIDTLTKDIKEFLEGDKVNDR